MRTAWMSARHRSRPCRGAGAGRGDACRPAAVCGDRGFGARARAAHRRAALLRGRRAAAAATAGLGGAALRAVLAAPGHHLRAPEDALRAAAAQRWLPHRIRRHAHAAPAAPQLRRGPRVRAQEGSAARHRALPPAPRGSRLRERQPGRESRRVRGARVAPRRLSHGQRHAAAHRPVRRRDRGHPALRPGDPAFPRCAAGRAAAPRSRRTARSGRGQGVPPPLSHTLRRGSDALQQLSRRERGAGADVRNFPTTAPRELRIDVRAEQPFAPLDTFLKGFAGRVLLAADSAGRREVLHEMLRAHGHEVTVVSGWDAFARGEARLGLTVAPDLKGLQLTTPAIAVVAEAQLFGARARQERRRKRAAAQIRDVAAELLDLNARRKAQPGLALAVSELDYQSFANAFPFEETEDQAQAIEQVLEDLKSERPMDRIVCGDVGFGKTEVAMRAAFVAAHAGKQVAVLAPTTLLVQQHLANFRDRFADWPVRIEALSRFGTGAETRTVLEGLEQGKVDIVIATHRLLHSHARFHDLGLLIIDEEHRFGVRDKQRLQALRANVHVLTLTATPIPRTLNMALGGLRDLSLITTAPAARLAIKTFLIEWHAPTLRQAALRELRRGGQVYFVHNEVRTIGKIAAELQSLVPEASLRIGHGQMRERELEQLMVDFYHRRFSVLVCTTIIESGIDVPTANTIIINRADTFGLAQLHQLRGRVGRSHHRAYAYLIAPPRQALARDAAKRLEAIESMEELGAGFVLATHDLEIRGAGELLGEQQSGQVTEIGLSLYLDMLEHAVRALKAGREPLLDQPLAAATEVELRLPAFLPEAYVGDVHVRLSLYKRIAAAESEAALDDLAAEIQDRFGPLPPAAQGLLRIARLKLAARALGVRRLDLGPQGGTVLFEEQSRIDPATVVHMIQRGSREYRLDGPLRLPVARALPTESARFEFAADLLGRLGEPPRVH